MCMRKAYSPLGHILFYLPVIPFHLPFPVFPKTYLFFYPREPFWSFSIFFGNPVSLILFPFDIFHGSSVFTYSPYLISPLFIIFLSHLFLLLILHLSFYPFSISIHCLLQPFFPQYFYLSFTCLFPHIKKEAQHGSHPTPTQKLSCEYLSVLAV